MRSVRVAYSMPGPPKTDRPSPDKWPEQAVTGRPSPRISPSSLILITGWLLGCGHAVDLAGLARPWVRFSRRRRTRRYEAASRDRRAHVPRRLRAGRHDGRNRLPEHGRPVTGKACSSIPGIRGAMAHTRDVHGHPLRHEQVRISRRPVGTRGSARGRNAVRASGPSQLQAAGRVTAVRHQPGAARRGARNSHNGRPRFGGTSPVTAALWGAVADGW
jgi:hypothetical protein